MIRPATLQDRAAIMGILKREAERYPLKADKAKMWETLTAAVSSSKHFAWVAEDEEGVKGVLLGLTSDNLWSQRMNCNIVAWVTDLRGEGVKLLRKFTEFVKSRRGIKVAGMSPDCDIDERVWLLAERVGFERRGGALLMYN